MHTCIHTQKINLEWKTGPVCVCVRLCKLGGGCLWKGLQKLFWSLLRRYERCAHILCQQVAALLSGVRSSQNKPPKFHQASRMCRWCFGLVQKCLEFYLESEDYGVCVCAFLCVCSCACVSWPQCQGYLKLPRKHHILFLFRGLLLFWEDL